MMNALLSPREVSLKFDAAIFADTQEEPAAVYRHLAWLQTLQQPQGRIDPETLHVLNLGAGVQSTALYLMSNRPPILVETAGSLGDDLMQGRNTLGHRCVSIPAFTRGDGDDREGRLRRQCSKEYKIEVIDRTIRRELLGLRRGQRLRTHVFQYFGISLDEAGRARRIERRFEISARLFAPCFPLLDRFMTRADCLTFLADKVPHQTPRSACVVCPYHSDAEWAALKSEDPDGWARAVSIDQALRIPGIMVNRGLDQRVYLHRSCKPLEEVEFDTRPRARDLQLSMSFWAECEGVCGV